MRLDQDSNDQTEEQRPIKQTFCKSLRRNSHWKCFLLTLLIMGCLSAIAWCRFTVVTRYVVTFYNEAVVENRASPCDDGYVYIPVAFVVMLYLVYLVECWHCHTRIELQYKVDVNTVYEKIQAMKDALPIVWWKAVCYHYVRRTRQVTRYRNGDAFTTTQVYYERVNSHTTSAAFNFVSCGVKDVSKTLINLEDYPATKIKFSKGFSFSAVEAENEFEDQRATFFTEHERRDDYMETREGLDLMNINYKEFMITFSDPHHLPWYVSHVVYWLCSFLLFSWPLRVLIEYKTAYVHFHIHKLFGCNYSDTSFYAGQMSRVSTMGSSELEMNIRNNYTMVPSYSEALLMERADINGNRTRLNESERPRNGWLSYGESQTRSYQNGHLRNGVELHVFRRQSEGDVSNLAEPIYVNVRRKHRLRKKKRWSRNSDEYQPLTANENGAEEEEGGATERHLRYQNGSRGHTPVSPFSPMSLNSYDLVRTTMPSSTSCPDTRLAATPEESLDANSLDGVAVAEPPANQNPGPSETRPRYRVEPTARYESNEESIRIEVPLAPTDSPRVLIIPSSQAGLPSSSPPLSSQANSLPQHNGGRLSNLPRVHVPRTRGSDLPSTSSHLRGTALPNAIVGPLESAIAGPQSHTRPPPYEEALSMRLPSSTVSSLSSVRRDSTDSNGLYHHAYDNPGASIHSSPSQSPARRPSQLRCMETSL